MFPGNKKKHKNGLEIIMKDNISDVILADFRLEISYKAKRQIINISIIQIYAPTHDHGDEEVQAFY